MLPVEAQAWFDEFIGNIESKKNDLSEPSNFPVNMTYVLSAMFYVERDQPAIMKDDYLATEPMMMHVSVEEVGKEESVRASLPEPTKNEPERVYIDIMVFSHPSLTLANHLKLIYVTAHLDRVSFKWVLIDGGATVKQMKKVCRSEDDLISTDLTASSFFGAITKTHGILPLEVDLGSKKIMLAFFVVDNTSTYKTLLGRDWIHQSFSVPSTLHQEMVVYH
ncbi:hypothetical protein FF1_003474 [Malus domestica]